MYKRTKAKMTPNFFSEIIQVKICLKYLKKETKAEILNYLFNVCVSSLVFEVVSSSSLIL